MNLAFGHKLDMRLFNVLILIQTKLTPTNPDMKFPKANVFILKYTPCYCRELELFLKYFKSKVFLILFDIKFLN